MNNLTKLIRDEQKIFAGCQFKPEPKADPYFAYHAEQINENKDRYRRGDSSRYAFKMKGKYRAL